MVIPSIHHMDFTVIITTPGFLRNQALDLRCLKTIKRPHSSKDMWNREISKCFGCFSFEATREGVDLCYLWEIDASFSHRDRTCKDPRTEAPFCLQSQMWELFCTVKPYLMCSYWEIEHNWNKRITKQDSPYVQCIDVLWFFLSD